MKRFFVWVAVFLSVVILGLYIDFVFFLPKQINIEPYIPQLKDLIKQNTNLDFEIKNVSLITTPLLEIGIKADDASISLPDDSKLFTLACLRAKLSLVHLLLLNVKVTDISLYKPVINIEINDNKEFKVVKTIENHLLNMEKDTKIEEISKANDGFDVMSLIRINVPNINLYGYRAYIFDNLTKDYIVLAGNKAKIGYYNGKKVKVKTQSKLYLNKDEHISFDVDIDSYIPKKGELDKEDDPDVRAEVPFINPVYTYKNYDPKGKVSAKIKIFEQDNKVKTRGEFDINDLTMDIKGYKIPSSYIKAKFNGRKTVLDTDLYLAKNQHLILSGFVKNSKFPDFDLNIFSDGVYFNDLILLSKGIMDSLGIKNNLQNIKAEGSIVADASIKTNSRTLKSKGIIEVKNGSFINTKLNLGIKNINAKVLLDENNLRLKDAILNVNNGSIKANAQIDRNSNSNLNILASDLPIPELYKAFAPDDIKSLMNINSGTISFNGDLSGKLKKPVSNLNAQIQNLSLSDKLNTAIVTNNEFSVNLKYDKKPEGKILNKGFKLSLPYASSSIKDDTVDVHIDDKNIILDPTKIQINSSSIITLKGMIENYTKDPIIDFMLNGNAHALELKQLLGTVAAPFVDARGVVPLRAELKGDKKKQTLTFQALSNSNGYITPIHIQSLNGRPSIIQFLADLKGNRIKIKDSGLFVKSSSSLGQDLRLNMTDASEVIGIEGTVAGLDTKNPVINMFKIKLKNNLKADIQGLKGSNLTFGGKLNVFGNLSSPRYQGGFYLKDVLIPDTDLKMKKASLSFSGKEAKFNTEDLTVADSDMKIATDIKLAFLPIIAFDNFKFSSNSIDLDKLMPPVNHTISLIPEDKTPKGEPNIPLIISSGDYNVKYLKTGNIEATNNKGDLTLYKNILYVNNISTDVFKGNVGGKVNVNLINSLINADVSGKNMDADLALIKLANMKDTMSGVLSFDTKVSLMGATYEEQVKSLDGVFNFTVKNGTVGPFSKIENLFLSENIRESEFFKTAMGSIVGSAVSFDTSHFDEMKGTIKFDKTAIAEIDPITMAGGSLCIKIGGKMDILANSLDAHVRGRLGSMVSSVLGPLANVNPINIVKATPGLNVVMAKAFSMFTESVSLEEMNEIPSFTKNKSDFNATKFQVILKGDVAKPLSMLKSFKWLVTDEEYKMAQEFVSSIPDTMPEGVSTLEELKAYQAEVEKYKAESKTLKGKIKHLFQRNKPEGINL